MQGVQALIYNGVQGSEYVWHLLPKGTDGPCFTLGFEDIEYLIRTILERTYPKPDVVVARADTVSDLIAGLSPF